METQKTVPIPIDPTKNVLDLVRAESKYQDGMRDAESRFQNAMRKAETRRIDELAEQRVYYDGIIEGMRANSLKLLAEQLKENKADSSERTSKLEQFRWESGGKSQSFGMIAVVITQSILILIALGGLAVALLRH